VGNTGKETYCDMEAAGSSKMSVPSYQSIRSHTAKERVRRIIRKNNFGTSSVITKIFTVFLPTLNPTFFIYSKKMLRNVDQYNLSRLHM
jgi:hypothetical protein